MRSIIILILLLPIANVFADEFNVDKEQKNVVRFISDAPIEEFDGTTKDIDGYLMADPSDVTKDSELYFLVELNTLDTGIGLRNRHMRENYLHTDKYPRAEFTGKIIEAKKNGKYWDVVVEGTMEIHGKKKKMKVNGKMTKTGNGFRIQADFIVKLSDHNIEIPSLMVSKIDENMKLQVDFYIMNVE